MKKLLLPCIQYVLAGLILTPLCLVMHFALTHNGVMLYGVFKTLPPVPAGLEFAITFWDSFYLNPATWIISALVVIAFEAFFRHRSKAIVRSFLLSITVVVNVLLLASMFLFLFASGSVFLAKRIDQRATEMTIESEQDTGGYSE